MIWLCTETWEILPLLLLHGFIVLPLLAAAAAAAALSTYLLFSQSA